MKSKNLASAVRVLLLLLLVSATCALAQDRRTAHLSGLFNDYVPLNTNISGSPYEMHGQWSMDLHLNWGTADFSADMTMSGFGRTPAPANAVDPTQPLVNPHTHHIKLTNVRITWNMTGCPPYLAPVPTTGFQLNGTVSLLTGNGSIAPFETDPPSSTLQVCVTGGNEVRYSMPNSNITLLFGGPAAAKHFGPQPIHGVVRSSSVDPIEKGREAR
jgi:hypothetical protein